MGREMIHIALLGAGRIGKIHGRNAAQHAKARLVSVSDAHQPAAEALAAETGAAVRSIEEAIAAPDIDAVLICTPTTTHADFIEVDLWVHHGRFEARHERRFPASLPLLFEKWYLRTAPRTPFGLADLLEAAGATIK